MPLTVNADAPPASRKSLSYRSVLSVGAGINIDRVLRSEVDAWLASKGLEVRDFGPDWVEVGPGAAVIWPIQLAANGPTRGRMRLAEASGFETRLTHVQAPGESGWLGLDIYAPRGVSARVPRILRNLLPFIDAHDGLAHVGERAELVRVDGVDELIDVICDPDRRGVVFVAGTDDSLPIEPWRELVDQVAYDTVGMAGSYLLDPAATIALEERIGPSHGVSPGTIRTYLPAADPASALDSRRHRYLGAARLSADSPRTLARVLATAAAREMVVSALPRDLVRAHRALDRIENDELVAAWQRTGTPGGPAATHLDLSSVPGQAAPSATTSTAADAQEPQAAEPPHAAVAEPKAAEILATLAEGVGRILGDPQLNGEAVNRLLLLAEKGLAGQAAADRVQQRLEDLQAQLEETEDVVTALEWERDDALEDFALAQADSNDLAGRVTFLQRALEEAGRPDAAWQELPDEAKASYPGSFEQLVAQLGTLEGVLFTGNSEATRALAAHDLLGTLADKAWDVMLALQDYVAAKRSGRFSGGLPEYLRNAPPGSRSVSAHQFVAVESETVRSNRSWRRQREFPVPTSVDASGVAFMEAHFRLGAKRTISPRVHILDATGRDGTVYVGYIGRHLDNTKTS